MTKEQTNISDSLKTKGQIVFEYILLALCFAAIALRATITESSAPQSAANPLSNTLYSMTLSMVLLASVLGWLLRNILRGKFIYRFTGIEIGIGLFLIAALCSIPSASNKRLALTGFITLLAPIITAVILIQIMDSYSKTKLLLCIITAVGVLVTYQCVEQKFWLNDQQIEFYEQNTQLSLEEQGITAGTLKQWQFEHRLYSKDVKSYFTTSNSAGSFLIMAAFSSIALLLEKIRNRKTYNPLALLINGAITATILVGLALTKSKGAIAAFAIAVAMFLSYICFGDWIKKHRKAIFVTILLLIMTATAFTYYYGTAHDSLPGGNSMLVRWQYWVASIKMYADHPLTGVGPGNFSIYYPHYKAAGALETVSDPHNFVLMMLSEYGSIGLIGFLAIFAIPILRIFTLKQNPGICETQKSPRNAYIAFLIFLGAVFLFVRPMIIPLAGGSEVEKTAAGIILYIIPTIVLVFSFLITIIGESSIQNTNKNMVAAAMFCAISTVLIHNLIDFAIFEPGVSTALWVIFAALIAIVLQAKNVEAKTIRLSGLQKILFTVLVLAIFSIYFNYAYLPIANASKADLLDPAPLTLRGKACLQAYSDSKDAGYLDEARSYFSKAIERDKANYKNYELLSQTYELMPDKTDEALENVKLAVERYPSNGMLRIKLAKLAEKLGHKETAIENYNKAVGTEDAFREQFKRMYPETKVFSRLSEDNYEMAKRKLKKLRP